MPLGHISNTLDFSSLALSFSLFLGLLRAQAIHHIVDIGYYALAARTTLNPSVFLRSYTRSGKSSSAPEFIHPQGRAGALCHPAVVFHTTTARHNCRTLSKTNTHRKTFSPNPSHMCPNRNSPNTVGTGHSNSL